MLAARRYVSEATQKTEGFPMVRFDLRRWQACGLALCFLLCAVSAHAIIREVDPGEMPALKADEGLLLAAIDSDVDSPAIRINREGVNLDLRKVRGKGIGHSYRLYVLPAGRYRWSAVIHAFSYDIPRDPEFTFEVKPGVLNYAGDLRIRIPTGWRAYVHVSNRGLPALDWLRQQHPALLRTQRFEYSGHYPDPFPAMYLKAVAEQAPSPDRTLDPPAAGELPLSLDALWRPARLQAIELNPKGDMFAEVVLFEVQAPASKAAASADAPIGVMVGSRLRREPRSASAALDKPNRQWRWGVNLVDIDSGNVVRLYDSLKPVSRLDWLGDRSLAMSIGDDHELDALIVTNVIDDAAGRRYDKVVVPRLGLLVKVLQDRPGRVLFASPSSDGFAVQELDVRDQRAVDRFDFTSAPRSNKGLADAYAFRADASGRIRMAVRTNKEGKRELLHGADGVYRPAMVLDEDADFDPVGLSPDGAMIHGLAEHDRGQRELVELDPATGRIGKTLFSRPGRDVIGPLYAVDGTLIGATYYENGLLVSDYFKETDSRLQRSLLDAFPGQSVTTLQRSVDGRRLLLLVGGSDKPSEVYHYDAVAGAVSPVSELQPWLAGKRFSPATVLHAKGMDGLSIEAYLTMPVGAKGKVPLVLFPHGGPIGVRDSRYFDPEVQLLASLGYAVLQVNFRGSEGFGTAFRKAGERSYGSAIEDDIDAALVKALAEYPIDADRMCALGSSYGGYSAMVSAIRWPGRFRCVVSIAGISDRVLFFTASDSARTEKRRKRMEQMIGDPNTEMVEMQRYSPLYRHEEIAVPVMLVHGREDLRVDYEHTRRLVRMLNLAGRPPVLIDLEKEGHGIEDDDNRTRVWTGIAGFLRQHLGDPLSGQGAAKPTP
jgi:dipeptidyl aminopeptidase/acylaminoacyl peptidase